MRGRPAGWLAEATAIYFTAPLSFVELKRLKLHLVEYSYVHNFRRVSPRPLGSNYVIDGITSMFPVDRLNLTRSIIMNNKGLPEDLGGSGTGFTYFNPGLVPELNVPFSPELRSMLSSARMAFEPGNVTNIYHNLYAMPRG